MKKTLYAIILACLVTSTVFISSAATATAPVSLVEDIDVDFPAGVSFSLVVEGEQEIVDIRLRYSVERLRHVEVVSEIFMVFVPDKNVEVDWYWDMRRTGGLPPGTGITYQWLVTYVTGFTYESDPRRIVMEDDRYDWQRITEGLVTLYWYHGGGDFAGELMAATQSALLRLADNTGAELEDPVRLYIYRDSQALRGALIFAQEWTGGVAFSPYGVVAIGIGTGESDLAWGKRVIAHELTHLVVNQVIFNPYGGIPTWLNEGLAVAAEGEPQASFVNAFRSGREQGNLISVRSLASPFSAYSDISFLAYAQSYEIVFYLLDSYGRDKMLALLETFADGSTYDAALESVYGFDMDGLNLEWLASLE